MKKEVGYIISYFSGVAKIQGLKRVFLNEVLVDTSGRHVGLVIGFDEQFVEALLFREDLPLDEPVLRSKKLFSIAQSGSYVGRVLNGLGEPIDTLPAVVGDSLSVFQEAPPIIDREPVHQPLSTGITIVDSSLPIGKGQRELIIGDRKLGKSTIAVDSILNQKYSDQTTYCVYVLIGQKQRQLSDLLALLQSTKAFAYTTIVAALSNDTLASQYLAPFVGCSIAEYFRDHGKHALIVYDDLSKHAKIYRDISLLLEQAPGREAYPGDVFSLHAQLLERAAQLSHKKGGGSLSALPIIETQEGDITSFIPTNIISITDGQIYFERGLYQSGFLPAVNIGLSVSRVGGQAQPALLRKTTKGLRIILSQQKELQKLTTLESTVTEDTKKKIKRGEIVINLLKQEKHSYISPGEQALLFAGVNAGLFDTVVEKDIQQARVYLLSLLRTKYKEKLLVLEKDQTDLEKIIVALQKDFEKGFLQ